LSLASRAGLRLYQELLARIQPIGPFREEIKKTSIHPIRGAAFAGVHPRKQHVLVTIGSAKPTQSARIARAEQVSKSRWHPDVKLAGSHEIDEELLGWLRQAYESMPLSFCEIDILHRLWGGQSCPQAGLPAGWTRWKAGPQAEKPAPQVPSDWPLPEQAAGHPGSRAPAAARRAGWQPAYAGGQTNGASQSAGANQASP
jgi:hypothetical protein